MAWGQPDWSGAIFFGLLTLATILCLAVYGL
jgi:hypothetical protein